MAFNRPTPRGNRAQRVKLTEAVGEESLVDMAVQVVAGRETQGEEKGRRDVVDVDSFRIAGTVDIGSGGKEDSVRAAAMAARDQADSDDVPDFLSSRFQYGAGTRGLDLDHQIGPAGALVGVR